jgi:hypothetical protein
MEPGRVITRRTFLTALGAGAAGLVGARVLIAARDRGATVPRGPIRADNLVLTQRGRELVLTPVPSRRDEGPSPVFRLNGTAASIWRAADGTHTPGEIAAQVAAAYAIPLGTAQRDTQQCLQTLERAGLVSAARG